VKNLGLKIKNLNYQKYWVNQPDGQRKFEKYWSQRNQNNFYGKILSSFVKRFGEEIIKKEVNMSSFFKAPIEYLPDMLDEVAEHLTDKALKSLNLTNVPLASQSSPNHISPVDDIPQVITVINESTVKKEKEEWLSDTDIDSYLS
jgi:hypothetical protein